MDPFIADEQGKNAVNYAIENNDFPLLEVFHQFWTKFIKLENLWCKKIYNDLTL